MVKSVAARGEVVTRPGGLLADLTLSILTELRSWGVADIFYLVCDGLKGMSNSVGAVFPEAIVPTCVVHLIRNSFRYLSKKYWPELAKDLKAMYGAADAKGAAAALDDLEENWGGRYPAIIRVWRNAWTDFFPFLDIDREIRGVLSRMNAIESLNSWFRRSVNSTGHFPTEHAAMKTLYLTIRSLDPKSTGQKRWMTRWKPVVNTLAIVFADRMPIAL